MNPIPLPNQNNARQPRTNKGGSNQHRRFSFRPLNPESDSKLIHSWVSQPYASYWGMQHFSEAQVQASYQAMLAEPGRAVFLGCDENCKYGTTRFLMERYRVEQDPIADCYTPEASDIGMHLLLAPASTPEHGFSLAAMQSVMEFLFSDAAIQRVVVEPDVRNEKIHALNKRVGFFHSQRIQLGEKTAYLAHCTRAQFAASLTVAERIAAPEVLAHKAATPAHGPQALVGTPALAAESLTPEIWAVVNRNLIRKALSELSHERILKPEPISANNTKAASEEEIHPEHLHWYQLTPSQINSSAGNTSTSAHPKSAPLDATNTQPRVQYRFQARRLSLDHWHIEAASISRFIDDEPQPLDAVAFILEIRGYLNIAKERFPIYLEEITSTLCSAAYKLHRPHMNANDLALADFQTIESAMTEGHPCFIANNGRIGFDAADYRAFAPEAGAPITLLWLAAHKSRTHFACTPDLDATTLFEQELDLSTREQFNNQLRAKNLNPDDYWLMPVHPWQWFNKLASVYAPELANGNLIMLGYGDDAYFAQQSIRTFFNASQPHKRYVKTALSILNMGFMRGLSAYYMRATPAINQWLRELVDADHYLQSLGFDILREVASVGYELPYYDRALVGDNPYRRMLAALWRENPTTRLAPNQRLMTMAALLHVDEHNQALLPALIKASGFSTHAWLADYLRVYLTPLLHCFYQYKLVFMPHGENLILVLENHRPVGVFMKDIGEEICLQNSHMNLPEAVARIAIDLPEEMELLAIFTDVFDCYFRFLAATVDEHTELTHGDFWQLVADCAYQYQDDHPALAPRFERYDMFAKDFSLSCLNRLQLKNNLQMVNLENPAESLTLHGRLANPLSAFRRQPSNERDARSVASNHFAKKASAKVPA
ncbi:GNAT family N-acetyltransferase [Simiduia sp. 21SJ11W-1]|uniref:GNAT family N-acetyltransferase n=1 Tax=Simiduia sp. 21SJ11W-1 TaxID=2909669 RepID=UPI00209ED3D8|nr:GNAT family N-acetyltransferase [Simiduia sp. 21SJ11W-1]UTA48962.1 GNAT family N-acetyltransferase [Simiduia sp. 21SJ11W-1]